MVRFAIALSVLTALAASAVAQEPFEGRTLISAMNSNNSHLIEMDGSVVQTWHAGHRPASMAYMLSDGSILRPCLDPAGPFTGGGVGGRIQRIDSNDNVVWDFYFSDSDHQQHHDIQPLPNGNVLLIAWEAKTQQQAIAAGRQTINGEMWPTLIVEVEPVGATGGNIVWEWHLWDHLIQDVDPSKPSYGVVADHPELIDINYGNAGGGPQGGGDWIHANAIDYHEVFDQIVFCSRTFNEIYVIDHSTTIEEAAGHTGGNSGMGGDILYRWGNPEAYDRGTSADRYFSVVHGANWIDPGLPGGGNILAFNNGDRPGSMNDYSTADEIVPPVDQYGNYSIEPGSPFGPDAPTWTYGGPGGFYGGASQCGAYRMPNGNTVICVAEGGYMFEVAASGTTVWEYDHPSGNVARAERYWDDTDVPAHDYEPGPDETSAYLTNAPNPFTPSTTLSFLVPVEGNLRVDVVDIAGRRIAVLVDGHCDAGRFEATWDGRDGSGREVGSGIYFAIMKIGDLRIVRKLALLR